MEEPPRSRMGFVEMQDPFGMILRSAGLRFNLAQRQRLQAFR